MRLRRLDQAPGEQRGKVKSRDLNTGGVQFDPAVTPLNFQLEVDGQMLTHATIGPADPVWEISDEGYRWKATILTTAQQVRRVDLHMNPAENRFRVVVRLVNLDAPGVAVPSRVLVTIALGSDRWIGATAECRISVGGTGLRCR
jgi:hypothetical protein